MVYIFTALYAEAKPLIHYFNLKNISSKTGFPIFEDTGHDLRIVITGTGSIAAAAAVGSCLAYFEATKYDTLINWGSCAGNFPVGSVFLCNKIFEKATGYTFYPDIFIRHQLSEAMLITESRIVCTSDVSSGSESDPTIHDMEAAGIYQAGSFFLSPHQMHFIKVISDQGLCSVSENTSKRKDFSATDLEKIMEHAVTPFLDYLWDIKKYGQDHVSQQDTTSSRSVEQLARDFCCSQTMKSSLTQHLHYWTLAGCNYQKILHEMYEKGVLPCQSKREGKVLFEQLKNTLLYSSRTLAKPSTNMANMERQSLHFSHIYVEKNIQNHPRVQKILHSFPHARIITIGHYKDVFCRKKQDVALQGDHPALILAAKQGNLLYPGAKVCQSFGNDHFYYTSCMMNCLYDCEYCYLKGMYPSGNIVIFVNLEDIFAEISHVLQKHDVYLCVSYDTDLMALENLTGFVHTWIEFAQIYDSDSKKPSVHAESSSPYTLKIEIRTKCGRMDLWDKLPVQKNVIFAFTLSPQEIISMYEHRTSSLADRIRCAKAALERGFLVRLCIDPILYHPSWRTWYSAMLSQIAGQLPLEQLYDVSVGSFRISKDYLKKLRHVMNNSAIVQFPFENDQGVYHYPTELAEEMESFVIERLQKHIPKEKIFRW